MKAGINGYPIRRAQCKTTGQIHDFIAELPLIKPNSTDFELALLHKNIKTGVMHLIRKADVSDAFWPMGFVSDDWPEDVADWPKTASIVQGGVAETAPTYAWSKDNQRYIGPFDSMDAAISNYLECEGENAENSVYVGETEPYKKENPAFLGGAVLEMMNSDASHGFGEIVGGWPEMSLEMQSQLGEMIQDFVWGNDTPRFFEIENPKLIDITSHRKKHKSLEDVSKATAIKFTGPQPTRATAGSAAYDLRYTPTDDDESIVVHANSTKVLPTGLSIELPEGYVALVCSRSGLAAKHGIQVLNAPGVIDSDYRGEIRVILHNNSDHSVIFRAGDRIAQLMIVPVLSVDWVSVDALGETDRGDGGFGSTGGLSHNDESDEGFIKMDIQRIRNLTAGLLHTDIAHVYQDLSIISGVKTPIYTHQIPQFIRAVWPWLREKITDDEFFDGKHNPHAKGWLMLPLPTKEEQEEIVQRLIEFNSVE